MPRTRTIKPKSFKGKSNSKSKSHKSRMTSNSSRLANLLNTISNNRNMMTKSEINLPARLMQSQSPNQQALEYSKSVSSTMTSSMHNGELHSSGKQVINDSTKPYIQVAELHNGQVEHFMIPRNQSRQIVLNHSMKVNLAKKKTKKTKKTAKNKKSSK